MEMTKEEIASAVAVGAYLPLMEAFYTLQGEGYHKGAAAYFIRVVVVMSDVIGAM